MHFDWRTLNDVYTVYIAVFFSAACVSVLYVTGANVLAADEEGETCLHLAFARHTATVNLDHADAVRQVLYGTINPLRME